MTDQVGAVTPLVHGSRAAPVVAVERERSLEATYLALAPAVLGYFRAKGAQDAEDLVGEVFVGVARGLPRFRGDDDELRRWVFSIAHRRLVDSIRRGVARPVRAVREAPDRPVHDGPHGLDVDLVRALNDLTPLQREVVLLRFVADLPTAAVARVLHRREGAVKALQVRALAQLAKALG